MMMMMMMMMNGEWMKLNGDEWVNKCDMI